VTREPTDEISLTRALAILAATFAIVFASLLPSAVAASAATDTPVQLCSGQIMPGEGRSLFIGLRISL
jgi:hypothetical protein